MRADVFIEGQSFLDKTSKLSLIKFRAVITNAQRYENSQGFVTR